MALFTGIFGRIFAAVFAKLILDSDGLRAYVLSMVESLNAAAARTETKLDDLFVKALSYVVTDDEAWAFVYGRIVSLYHMIVDDGVVEELDKVRLTADAEEAGLDPTWVVLVIEAAVALFKWWRERKTTEG